MQSRVHRSPLVVVISGPSGVGKDAMLNRLRLAGAPYHFAVTATTRPMRAGEKDGVDYIFMSAEEFGRMKDEGEFLESAEVYGNSYGVPRPQVRQALRNGQDVVIKMDVQGAGTIRRLAPQAVLVFIAPPSMDELERRLRWRLTESDPSLRVRVETARQEMEQLMVFDYVVVNDILEESIQQLQAIISAEKCRLPPRQVRV